MAGGSELLELCSRKKKEAGELSVRERGENITRPTRDKDEDGRRHGWLARSPVSTPDAGTA